MYGAILLCISSYIVKMSDLLFYFKGMRVHVFIEMTYYIGRRLNIKNYRQQKLNNLAKHLQSAKRRFIYLISSTELFYSLHVTLYHGKELSLLALKLNSSFLQTYSVHATKWQWPDCILITSSIKFERSHI